MSPEKPQTGRVVSFDRYKKSGEIKPDKSVIPISFTTKDVVMIRKEVQLTPKGVRYITDALKPPS